MGGTGAGRMDLATISAMGDPDVDLAQVCDYRSERGFSRALEDRREESLD